MLKLPSIFSDSMVLQRNKRIEFWGSSHNEGSRESLKYCVSVSLIFNNSMISEAKTFVHTDESWECSLPSQKEGGPYILQIVLYEEISVDRNIFIDKKEFSDVMIGEVWLAGGQSNMEYELCNDIDGSLLLENPPDIPVRYFYTPKIPYVGPELLEAEKHNTWQKNGCDGMKHWSSLAYFTIQRMSSEFKGVTFGIIGCNWGGSYAVNWMDKESSTQRNDTAVYQREFEEKIKDISDEDAYRITSEYKEYHEKWSKKVEDFQSKKPNAPWKDVLAYAGECKWPGPMTKKHEFRPGGLYESMIKRIVPYSLRGFLYYQGESDDKKPQLYKDLLTTLVLFWRRIWKDSDLYFMIFQLTVYDNDEDTSGTSWAYIRQAQVDVFNSIRNTGLTVISDCGEKKDIHPKGKKIPGMRAGDQLLKDVYGLMINNAYCPVYESYEIDKDSILIRIKYAEEGLFLKSEGKILDFLDSDMPLNPFIIWDHEGLSHCSDVVIEKNNEGNACVLKLSSPKIPNPSGASYGWSNYFTTMLYCGNKPVSPFNTNF